MATESSDRLLGVLGLVGAAGGASADVITMVSTAGTTRLGLLQSPSFDELSELLIVKTHEQLVWGHYSALAFLPLGIAGVIHVASKVRRGRTALLAAGSMMYVWGTAYHATFGLVGTIVRGGDSKTIERAAAFFEPLGYGFTGASVLLLAVFAYWIARGRTDYPTRLAWLSPLPVQLGLVFLAQVLPPVLANLLLASALNLSVFVFLALSVTQPHRATASTSRESSR